MTWYVVLLGVAAVAAVKYEVQSGKTAIPFAVLTAAGTSVNDGDPCDSNSFSGMVCENDKLIFCGPQNKITSAPCMVRGRKGFCNCEKDGCVAEKPSCTNEKPTCYESNIKLPDNLDCHKFSYCNRNNEKIVIKCPGNLIYDPSTGKCMDRNTAPCKRIMCPRRGKMLQLIPFPQAKNFYLLCYEGLGDVRKCPLKNYAVRDNKCQFDCNMQNITGIFQDTNETKCKQGIYYACVRVESTFRTIQKKCPEGMTLNESLELCTTDENCKKTNESS